MFNNIEDKTDKYAVNRKEVLDKIRNNKVVIYGYGAIGKGLISCIKNLKSEIVAICDSNKVGIKTEVGIIESFDEVSKRNKDFSIIICSRDYYEEIKSNLINYVSEEKIINGSDFYHNYINYFSLEDDKNNPFAVRKDIYVNMLKEHSYELENISQKFYDEKSKMTMINIFKHILTGNSEFLRDIYEPVQYFCKDIVSVDNNEIFIDGGAYIGDTLESYLKEFRGTYKKIYCFEPEKEQFERLNQYIKTIGRNSNIKALPFGLSNKGKIVGFQNSGTSSRISDESNPAVSIKTVRLDEIIKEKVTFIKMDIEGEELNALKGAKEIICKYKPKLAICVYHKPEDLYEIPKYIMDFGLDYKYYLRHHMREGYTETVFYAI
ncbi:FkbM family methyltransferase [Clostridium butyricum]|nr:FkbM family methyltransferase [Clostridium butyricum]MCQ2026279.1 FkbM family methyltransferase [Clostridium butyricum]